MAARSRCNAMLFSFHINAESMIQLDDGFENTENNVELKILFSSWFYITWYVMNGCPK